MKSIPWFRWLIYIIIAFGGSAVYGVSLSLLFPRWDVASGALWIILSSGMGWVVLGIGMVIVYRRKMTVFAMANCCLITMAYGISVLLIASIVNGTVVLLALPPHMMSYTNVVMVFLSNITMASVFSWQLVGLGVSRRQSLLLFIALLDGSGVLFFWLFERMLA